MRLINTLFAVAFVVLGLVFGVLNRQQVHLDLWLREYDLRLGVLLLVVLLFGALLGGAAVAAGIVWPMRRERARQVPARDPGRDGAVGDRGAG
jgi:putative membrane protein